MRDYFSQKLLKLAKLDSKVYVLDGDLANSTKTDSVAKHRPDKFIQCGIAEQNMVGIAAGLATTGLQPWVATFTPFLVKRALDQITVSVAQPNLDVKLIGCYSGILNGKIGKTHQGIEDLAIMRTIPNMTVLSPADGIELEEMMQWANEHYGPVYIRLTRESKLLNIDEAFTFDLKAKTLNKGSDITIISTGTHTKYALEATRILERNDISINLIHMPSIKPIDRDAIIEAALTTKGIITVEDHSVIGGLGSAVTEITSESAPTFVIRIGINDKNIEAGESYELLQKYGLSTEDIVYAAKTLFEK